VQYEEVAVDFASHPKKLKILKEKLTSNVRTMPLYNTQQFTRSLEAAYLVMHDRCQHGEHPDDIYVVS